MSALELEGLIYNLLKTKIKLPVYNHVPEDAVAPFIKVDDISFQGWLLTPRSAISKIALVVFSEKLSNLEVIKIAEQIRDLALSGITRDKFPSIIQSDVSNINIFQLKNLTWCAEVNIEIKQYNNK